MTKINDRIRYEFVYKNNVIAPGLALEEAKAYCPAGFVLENVEFGTWEGEREIVQNSTGETVAHRNFWETKVRVWAARSES